MNTQILNNQLYSSVYTSYLQADLSGSPRGEDSLFSISFSWWMVLGSASNMGAFLKPDLTRKLLLLNTHSLPVSRFLRFSAGRQVVFNLPQCMDGFWLGKHHCCVPVWLKKLSGQQSFISIKDFVKAYMDMFSNLLLCKRLERNIHVDGSAHLCSGGLNHQNIPGVNVMTTESN